MKKALIKTAVFLTVFLIALVVSGRVMNKGQNNLTMEMAQASFPVITMERGDVFYNELHGYANSMDTAFQREHITVLGANRDVSFRADTYGRSVTSIMMEVRTIDGERLIERTEITDYELTEDGLNGSLALKDLIEADEEYSLALILTLDGEQEIYYYTRVIWSEDFAVDEKLAFVQDFHERLYDREQAKELTRYLETNAQLEDNSSFAYVNIHSSFRQITWGDLDVQEVGTPVYSLTDIAEQTASFLVDYTVTTQTEEQVTVYYRVQEYYRVRYTTDRMYLLDYERTMTQIPDTEHIAAGDKLLLGIVDEDVQMLESEDGNIVAFVADKQLLSYNTTSNKLAEIFSFYDRENADARTTYDNHDIRILDVDEAGNVRFAVYGYMNRGRHEGEVGVGIFAYDSATNTIEEAVWLPYDKSYSALALQMEQLLYVNRDDVLYLLLDNTVYGVDLEAKTYAPLVENANDRSLRVSDDHGIVVWQEGTDSYRCTQLNLRDLNTGTQTTISADSGDYIMPLGFMGEDIIYGVAHAEDVEQEHSGRTFFPMYRVCICDAEGTLLKDYSQTDIYVTACFSENNQITLERVRRLEDGTYQETTQDQIMNNAEQETGENTVAAADIDVYERYVQIQTGSTIDTKTLQVLTPKEIVFEGVRELELTADTDTVGYYVYGGYGASGIYTSPADAVSLAYELSGTVTDERGHVIWLKGNRSSRNQIMAITEAQVTEETSSLAVCLDTILAYEGVVRNSQSLLDQGQTAMEILTDGLENARILDLTGCSLDAVLYYVNRDIPVLALLEDGEAVLVTGFNEYNVVIMEPSSGTLYKKGLNDAAEWFEENGNSFITYIEN